MGESVFETERTIARPWHDDEAERMYDLYSRWEVSRWLGNPPKPMKHLGEAHTTIERWAGVNARSGFGGIWAVERKTDGLVLGTVLLVELKGGDGEYEIGWHFHPDSWGHGYATESARGGLERAWVHGLDEVFGVVYAGNDASLAVCRRLGMTHLGLTSKYYDTELELFRLAAPSAPAAAERDSSG